MKRLLAIGAAAALSGCAYYAPYGYGYNTPYYGAAPGYYNGAPYVAQPYPYYYDYGATAMPYGYGLGLGFGYYSGGYRSPNWYPHYRGDGGRHINPRPGGRRPDGSGSGTRGPDASGAGRPWEGGGSGSSAPAFGGGSGYVPNQPTAK